MFYFKITFDLFFSMNLHILNTLTRYCLVVKEKNETKEWKCLKCFKKIVLRKRQFIDFANGSIIFIAGFFSLLLAAHSLADGSVICVQERDYRSVSFWGIFLFIFAVPYSVVYSDNVCFKFIVEILQGLTWERKITVPLWLIM